MSDSDNTNPPTGPVDPVAYGAGGNGTGREPGTGRFGPGNKFAKGNAYARQVQEIRRALFEVATYSAVKEAAVKLMDAARAGDLRSFQEVLDRTVGRSVAMDLEERLSALEQALSEQRGRV